MESTTEDDYGKLTTGNDTECPSKQLEVSLLRTHDLTIRMGSHLAVDRCDLDVRPGRDSTAFLGRNGAGKNEYIRCDHGILKAGFRGSIELVGTTRRIGNQQKRLIGLCFPRNSFSSTWNDFGQRSANLSADCSDLGRVERPIVERARPACDSEDRAHLSVACKSSWRSRSRWLTVPEDFDSRDEPTAGLDPVAPARISRHQSRQQA